MMLYFTDTGIAPNGSAVFEVNKTVSTMTTTTSRPTTKATVSTSKDPFVTESGIAEKNHIAPCSDAKLPDLSASKGKLTNRIHSGTKVEPGMVPWQVRLH